VGLFLRRKDGGEGRLIGHGGLRRLEEFGETELLYALHPDMWGKGYASELGGASLKHAFDTVGLSLVFAITKPENLSSQGVMKRLGMSYRKKRHLQGGRSSVVRHRPRDLAGGTERPAGEAINHPEKP